MTIFAVQLKTDKTMKAKHIYYFGMIVCFFMTTLGISCEDDKAILFGMLGIILNGVHYLDEKIDELKK